MIKSAREALTSDSTTQDFIVEMAKNIANFITTNRTAFSQDNAEALSEFLIASSIDEVKQKALDYIDDPQLLRQEDKTNNVTNLETEEQPIEEQPIEAQPESQEDQQQVSPDDLVSDDIMKMLED